jgi:hypothetical protein
MLVLALVAALPAAGGVAHAQSAGVVVPIAVRASAGDGVVQGVVQDETGARVAGVTLLALGATLSTTRSDRDGRFVLPLAPGEYILRASRQGYVSVYREALRIQTSVVIERRITVTRKAAGSADVISTVPASEASHRAPSDTEAAWRLRLLPPSILRDRGAAADPFGDPAAIGGASSRRADALAPTAGVRWADLTGQINYLAGSSVPLFSQTGVRSAVRLADVSVGASIGAAGRWSVRSVMDTSSLSSWAVRGDYQSRATGDHVLTAGVAYSAQAQPGATLLRSDVPGAMRTAGSARWRERWHFARGVDVDYGVQIDRYDYLNARGLGRVDAKVGAAGPWRTSWSVAAFQHAAAPGAGEFVVPDPASSWLPASRTFAGLDGEPFVAQRVRHVEVAIARPLGGPASDRSIAFRRFVQSTRNQHAALFGLESDRDAAHYLITTAGDVGIDGWGARLTGRLLPRVHGTIDYSSSRVEWDPETLRPFLRASPSIPRLGGEHLHDVTAVVDVRVPRSATTVSLAYRTSTGFSRDHASTRPSLGGRFDLRVYHAPAYQPIRGGEVELLLALRTIYGDVTHAGSMYDELLTVAPPLRLLAGVRVKF